MAKLINAGDITIGQGAPLALISGPCVIENYETTREIAAFLKQVSDDLDMPFVFKASYDKANRTSVSAFRGPGLINGLKILEKIKKELAIPILSDVHRISEIPEAAKILD
ncbi:MAG: 3-deoxy-8-phosphooctulonate synthase, partial [Deltaproteobacteria bacterium]|nr:3-deoxy-8-phosphooctulonate synthase [Deltaproteobacteria bacterium]